MVVVLVFGQLVATMIISVMVMAMLMEMVMSMMETENVILELFKQQNQQQLAVVEIQVVLVKGKSGVKAVVELAWPH